MPSTRATPTDPIRYSDAANLLGVSVETLRSWVCRGKVPHYRLSRRYVVFDRNELTDWLRARYRAAGE